MAETLVTIGPQFPGQAMDVTEDQNLNDDSSSDSDSDSDDDAQENLQIQTLETELSTNPANYDTHVQYIRALRKEGDIEKMRRAREGMNEIFPLTPAMWQEWAKDEACLTSGTDAFHAIEKIYERGVSDYLSVPLWCDYINFVKESDLLVHESSAEGISKARNLFEKALTAAGCHVAEGSKIWGSYLEFEQSILKTITESDTEGRERQVKRIRNLFHRQLSVPLVDLKSNLSTYKAWEAEQGDNSVEVNTDSLDGIASHVTSSYQKASEILNARSHLEDQISRQDLSDSEKLQNYMTYLKFEESSGTPVSVQVLYERAVTEFPISGDLWLDYTRYLDKTLKASKILKDIYNRATKNCPWVGELWVRFLLSLEGSRASEEDISSVFEKSLLCTFSSLDEYLNIFLTRVDGLRRRISAKLDNDTLDYGAIRQTFQRAFDYLSPQLKNTNPLLQMISYWARLESNLGKDVVAARSVWESLLKISGSMIESWQGYISMEIEMGHLTEARSLYKRCYTKRFSGTGSEDICKSWVRFEREYGTLEEFHHAVQKVTPRLEELQSYRLQQESKYIPATTDQTEIPAKKNAREKRKPVSDITDEQSPAKRPKGSSAKPLKEVDTKQKGQANNANEESKNKKPQTSKGASEEDKKPKDSKFERPQYTDKCTAFVSNINLKANYEDLHKFFSDVGGVTSIRLLMDKFTKKSRGLAYVDFLDDEHLASALAKNKQMLLGKRVSIARSNPKQNKRGKGDQGHGDKQDQGPSNTDDNIELKGKNTFAMPRAVRPLGIMINKDKPKNEQGQEGESENPKSNDEFRKMLFEK